MDAQKREARNLRQQEPGSSVCHANAADIQNVAKPAPKRQQKRSVYHVTPSAGEPFDICVKGRDTWALDRLTKAGNKGGTPITEPNPRWSEYVFNLRTLGLEIETVTENHVGDYPGHHARYVLRSPVVPMTEGARHD